MFVSVRKQIKKKVNVFIEIEDVMKKYIGFLLIVIVAIPLIVLAQITTKVYKVDDDKCIGCTICVRNTQCPTDAIEMKNGKAVIDASKCIACGVCAIQCPVTAISEIQITDTSQAEDVQEASSDTIQVVQNMFIVDKDACIGCTICVQKCPTGAISMKDGKAVIDQEKCIQCGICETQCPVKAISQSTDADK